MRWPWIISQVKKLKMIVRMKKLATNNNKIFVCTMKKTSVNYRMVPTLLPCFYPLHHFQNLQQRFMHSFVFCTFQSSSPMITSQTTCMVKRRGRYSFNTHGTILKSCWRGRRLGGQLSIATGLKLQGHSTSLKAQYLPSASVVSQMRFICLFNPVWCYFPKFFDAACETWCCCVMALLSFEAIWCNSIMKSWLLLYGYEISSVFYKKYQFD